MEIYEFNFWFFLNFIDIIKNSESAITRLKVIEKNRCIIAASKEKSIKVLKNKKKKIILILSKIKKIFYNLPIC